MRHTKFLLMLIALTLVFVSCTDENDMDYVYSTPKVEQDQRTALASNQDLADLIRNHPSYPILLEEVKDVYHHEEQARILTMSPGQLFNFYEELAASQDEDYVLTEFSGISEYIVLLEELDQIKTARVELRRGVPDGTDEEFNNALAEILADDTVDATDFPDEYGTDGLPCFEAFNKARRDAYDRCYKTTVMIGALGKIGVGAALMMLAHDLWRAGMEYCMCMLRTYGDSPCYN